VSDLGNALNDKLIQNLAGQHNLRFAARTKIFIVFPFKQSENLRRYVEKKRSILLFAISD
jgi:hypothetical protein